MWQLLVEIVPGCVAVGLLLMWWQHDIDLKAIRKDFEVFKGELEKTPVLGTKETPEQEGWTSVRRSSNL